MNQQELERIKNIEETGSNHSHVIDTETVVDGQIVHEVRYVDDKEYHFWENHFKR